RIICKFAKTAVALEVKAGVVEGNVYDAAGIQALSTVPSREVLLAKLLGSMQSPITNLARVLKQIAEKDGGAAEPVAEETAEPAAAEPVVEETTEPVTES
ncbi:MAG: 50S ribosomal protein L10, partial [Lachnospiraceae bacterium]